MSIKNEWFIKFFTELEDLIKVCSKYVGMRIILPDLKFV